MPMQATLFLSPSRRRPALLAALFCAELIALALTYQFTADIQCNLTGSEATCDFLSSLVARALVIFAVAGILIRARPAAFTRFLDAAALPGGMSGLAVHLAGLVLLLVPLALMPGRDLGAVFYPALLPWSVGALAATLGGLLWLAPAAAWRDLLSQNRFAPVPILLAAAMVPDLADLALPLWDWQALTTATFMAVDGVLRMFSSTVQSSAPDYVIGMGDFFVHIAQQCSGVEGFALVTAFVALYAVIFRQDIRLGRFLLVVLPLGILLSWTLNILRIAALIAIGDLFSPDLAVNGFHSYAGWLFFTLLAFGLIWFVQSTAWLHRAGSHGPASLPIRHDPAAAAILPFAVFMVASTLVAALFAVPDLGYPIKALALAAAVGLFWPVIGTLRFTADPPALASGLAVGIFWLVMAEPPDADLAAGLTGLGGAGLAVWLLLRLFGTVLLVPMVEELFFRGYLLTRLDGVPLWRRVLALAVSSLAFAALHGRWLEAGVAGLIFGMVMLRRGRVEDAILSHLIANAVIAAVALARGDWSLI